ncbi:MAG: xylulokinase [Gaiellaceae bacterium]
MSSEPTIVGLDVGTSGVKALAISPSGEILAKAEEEYPLSIPRPGWAEQDPEDWWRASERALARLGRRPSAIGLSGQMHGLVCLDGEGRVLRPAILWNDQRTGAECAEIEAQLGLDRLVALTGNRALAGFTAPKLLWLRRHEPETYARIARIMLPKDYLRLRLTGEHAIDVSDASGTLLFDVANRSWSDELLAALELPPEWLPRALESPAVSGLTEDGVPVSAGAGDQAAAALGVGIVRPGPLSIVLGTSGVVFAALPSFVADPEARLHVFCHAVPETWHAMGVMLSAAGSLRWLRDLVGGSYDDLLAGAESWPPGTDGLAFAPYLSGERTPHADPNARGAFVGLELRHDRGALTRAVLEGVAFGLRDSLELVRSLGVEPTLGRVSGGGARSALWLRIVASVLRLPLEQTAVEEGSAFGAALLGGVAAGVFASVQEAVERCVRVRATVEPEGDWQDPYGELYFRFRTLYPTLRPLEES